MRAARRRRESRAAARHGRRGVRVEVQRRVRSWSPTRRDLARWASVAAGGAVSGCELGVCVVGAPESRRLNARFRGRDVPTNVLSFASIGLPRAPARGARVLGELVICPRVLRAEARAQDKSLKAHWAHLVVHGTLHLLGYDHERAADARRMERREIALLKRLGFANPYRSS